MKKANKLIVKLQVVSFLAIGVATPCLCMTCVTPDTCYINSGSGVVCSGNDDSGGGSEHGDWIPGGSCGKLFYNGHSSTIACGIGIATECG